MNASSAPPGAPGAPGADEGWGFARTGAVAFVAAAPVVACFLFLCLGFCWSPKPCKVYKRRVFWMAAALQAAALGFAVGLWAHWVPCAWLACDLGPGDDVLLRGALLFVVWGVASCLLLLPCICGVQYGLTLYFPWPGARLGEGPGLLPEEDVFVTELVRNTT